MAESRCTRSPSSFPLQPVSNRCRHACPVCSPCMAREVGFEPTKSWLRTRWLRPLAVTPQLNFGRAPGGRTQISRIKSPVHNRSANALLNFGAPLWYRARLSGFSNQRFHLISLKGLNLVSQAGFEPATSCTPCTRATRLRYWEIESGRPRGIRTPDPSVRSAVL